MEPVNETIHHTGLSDEERELLREYGGLREAAVRFPVGSALREMLDHSIATLEIKLGL